MNPNPRGSEEEDILKILSISTVFPNPDEPGVGPFVRHRLQRMACGAEIRVVAPVPVVDYGRQSGRWIRSPNIPHQRIDGRLQVEHPGWLYPPMGGVSNAVWMYLHQLEGELPLMPDLMSAADLLCLASNREGWPNVVHEAMACGTPVVATSVGGVEDTIPDDESGYIVPPGDRAALTAALDRALNRDWNRDAVAAWARSRSWEQVAGEVLAVMQSVIEERS